LSRRVHADGLQLAACARFSLDDAGIYLRVFRHPKPDDTSSEDLDRGARAAPAQSARVRVYAPRALSRRT
jgi:hypothetical protein